MRRGDGARDQPLSSARGFHDVAYRRKEDLCQAFQEATKVGIRGKRRAGKGLAPQLIDLRQAISEGSLLPKRANGPTNLIVGALLTVGAQKLHQTAAIRVICALP